MTFIHTNHATHRLKTRGIPPPDIVRCVRVGKRDLRRIRQLCPVNFNKDEYSYFRSGGNVYVTKEIQPDTYLLITAFQI